MTGEDEDPSPTPPRKSSWASAPGDGSTKSPPLSPQDKPLPASPTDDIYHVADGFKPGSFSATAAAQPALPALRLRGHGGGDATVDVERPYLPSYDEAVLESSYEPPILQQTNTTTTAQYAPIPSSPALSVASNATNVGSQDSSPIDEALEKLDLEFEDIHVDLRADLDEEHFSKVIEDKGKGKEKGKERTTNIPINTTATINGSQPQTKREPPKPWYLENILVTPKFSALLLFKIHNSRFRKSNTQRKEVEYNLTLRLSPYPIIDFSKPITGWFTIDELGWNKDVVERLRLWHHLSGVMKRKDARVDDYTLFPPLKHQESMERIQVWPKLNRPLGGPWNRALYRKEDGGVPGILRDDEGMGYQKGG